MFDIGLGELLLIAFIAVLMFGPDKLPDLAKQSAGFIRKIRDFATHARDELRSELGPEFSDLELRDLDPRAIVRKHIDEALAEDYDLRPRAVRRDGDGSSSGPSDTSRPLEPGETPPYDVDAT